jgi:hypothetical protein
MCKLVKRLRVRGITHVLAEDEGFILSILGNSPFFR